MDMYVRGYKSDTHVQNVNRNALKVTIECERVRVSVQLSAVDLCPL